MQHKFNATDLGVQEVIRISGSRAVFLSSLLHEGRVLRLPSGTTAEDFHVPVPTIAGSLERCRWCCGRIWPVILDGEEFYDCNVDWDESGTFADLSSPHDCNQQLRRALAGSKGDTE